MPSLLDRAKSLPDVLRRTPVVGTVMAVNARYGDDAGGQFAASIAFFAFLSLFPLLLLAMSIIGFVLAGDPAGQEEWVTRLSDAVPGLSAAVGESISSLIRFRTATGLVGLFGLMWTGLKVIESASFATNRVFGVDAAANVIKAKAKAMMVLVSLGSLALATLVIAGAVGGIRASGLAAVALKGFGLALSVVLDALLFIVSYRLLTSGKGPTWRKLVPGAIVGGVGYTLLKVIGSWYVRNNITQASAVYGTFASVVAVLLILYMAARIYLYGAEFNAWRIAREGDETPRESLSKDEDVVAAEEAADAAGAPPAEQFERDPRSLVS